MNNDRRADDEWIIVSSEEGHLFKSDLTSLHRGHLYNHPCNHQSNHYLLLNDNNDDSADHGINNNNNNTGFD